MRNDRDFPFMQQHYSCFEETHTSKIVAVCHALASPERIKILRMLQANSMTVSEVAKAMYMAVSTATFHLDLLRNAGMIKMVLIPGKRRPALLCQLSFTALTISALPEAVRETTVTVKQEIPVGLYTACGMEFVSGFCTAGEQIMFDDGNYFTSRRTEAQLLWASGGYVEYSASNTRKKSRLRSLSISLEICSETLNYQIGWRSDISIWLNGHELCTFTSPSDFGGRRGQFNPPWWQDTATQFGELKIVTITADGCFLNGNSVAEGHSVTISDFDGADTFVFRIGNKSDAKYKGGFNIFGKGFDDYPQDILVEAEYDE